MKTVRAKFTLIAAKNEDGSTTVSGWPVTDGSEENKKFNEYTPGGNLSIHIAKGCPAENDFEIGVRKEYYVDLIEAPVAVSNDSEDQGTIQ